MFPPVLRTIPVLAESHDLREIVERALAAEDRYRLLPAASWEELADLISDPQAQVALVALHGADARRGAAAPEAAAALRRIQLQRPDLRVVVVSTGPPTAGVHLRLANTPLLWLPAETARVPHALARASFEARDLALRRRLAACVNVPPALRGALAQLLRLVPLDSDALEAYDGLPEHGGPLEERKVASLALTLGTRPRILRKQAAMYAVRLRRVGDARIGAMGAALHEFEDVGWDEVAWRLGYGSLAGLTNLYRRVFRRSLRQIKARPAEELLVHLETKILGRFWEPAERRGAFL